MRNLWRTCGGWIYLFVRRLLSHLPGQRQRQFRAPLRRVEYFDGCALYRDSRRKAEVYIDPSSLPLVGSDLEPVEASRGVEDWRHCKLCSVRQIPPQERRMGSG